MGCKEGKALPGRRLCGGRKKERAFYGFLWIEEDLRALDQF